MKRLWNSLRRDDRQLGQALVELTVVVIVALILLGGLIEFGWAYFRYLAMQDAAAEGAAFGIIHPTWHNSGDNADPDNIVYRTQHESESEILDWSMGTVGVDAPFMTPGNLITVTLTFDHDLITPLLLPIVGRTITLQATAVQRIISPIPPPPEPPPYP